MVEVIRQVCRWIRAVLRRWKIPPAVWKALLITAVGAFVITRWDFSGSPVDSTASQRTDCPSDVTRYFAPGAEDAVLVEAYHTASFVVTICQDASGALHYDGRKRGLPVTPRTHIALPAQKDPFGHVARNGTFEYRMTGSRLVVTNSGRVLVDEAATLISP
ncbi:hypothetical protein [Goodfellowiella coeruleoviolacea]|uniref:hypothetical protein n=1 Tax=Goodfellowiella coeruleoviolacea TaxID=334858 RepID=UPI0020A32598|nr:hypothetical protein [Goodfellowiella coeruleoviolacea]